MKLGWQRAGAAATLLWALAVCLYLYSLDVSMAAQARALYLKACLSSPGADAAHCHRLSIEVFQRAAAIGWRNGVTAAPSLILGPALLGWNIFFTVRALLPWARRKFRQ